MESMQTLSGRVGQRARLRRAETWRQPRGWPSLPGPALTDVVGLIEDHNCFAGQLLGHQVCNLGVQEVVVAVNHHVGMQDLGGQEGELCLTSTHDP